MVAGETIYHSRNLGKVIDLLGDEWRNSETANLLRQAVDNFISKIPIDRNAKGKNGVTILLQLNIEHVAILPPRSEASNVSVNEVKLKDSE